MDREQLEALSKPELMMQGDAAGIKLTPAEKKGDMIDKLLGLPVAEAKAADANLPPERGLYNLDGTKSDGHKLFKVMIMASATDASDVFLAVNGHGIHVKRGVEVILSEPYVEVLKHSVIDTMSKDEGKSARMQVMTIPFSATAA